jgi:hypothetical protein
MKLRAEDGDRQKRKKVSALNPFLGFGMPTLLPLPEQRIYGDLCAQGFHCQDLVKNEGLRQLREA